jgi:hypothetical protein
MWTQTSKREYETVTVSARGRVLERMSFATTREAEDYKRSIRRWAWEKGVIIGVWSQRDGIAGVWSGASMAAAG